jgi:cell division FtsZ-interacting protein ZapD
MKKQIAMGKITLEHIKVLLIAAVLVYLFLPKKGKQIVDRIGEIAAKDEVIKSLERERDTYRAWKDEAVAILQKKDSELQKEVKTTIIKYEKIPAVIRNYNNEELRRAVTDY